MALEDIVRDMNSGGLGATWSAGQKYAADRASTLAQTASTQANTDRTTQMTPSAVLQSQGQAEATRLGNLNPQAEEQQGLPGTNAQIKAQQAKQILNQIPQKVLEEAHQKTQKATVENLGIMVHTMESTGNMNQALAAARAHLQDAGAQLPQEELSKQMAEFDKAAQQAQQKYGANPSQWVGELKDHMYKIAGNQSLSDPSQQGKLQVENMHEEGANTRAQIGANATITAANTRAVADSNKAVKPTADQFLYDKIKEANPNDDNATLAHKFVQAKTVLTKETPSLVSPTGVATTTTTKGEPSGASKGPSPAKIMQLQQNPSPQMRKYFDEAFGEGASARALGK